MNWQRSQKERIQRPHSSVTQRNKAYGSHEEWKSSRKKRPSTMGITPPPLRRQSSFTRSWLSRCRQGTWHFSLWEWSTPSITCGSPRSWLSPRWGGFRASFLTSHGAGSTKYQNIYSPWSRCASGGRSSASSGRCSPTTRVSYQSTSAR